MMRLLVRLSVSCCALLFPLSSYAKILVVTDIDDTLKQSHVLDYSDMLKNALRTNNPFSTMSGVLKALKMDHPQVDFVYLSNAPDGLMSGRHARFLADNSFPEGRMRLRGNTLDGTFKLTAIRHLLKTEKPVAVILIGDNGEADAVVYDEVRKEFPTAKITTFIHLVYSVKDREEPGNPVLPMQYGYATGFDLALMMQAMGIIKVETAKKFYDFYGKTFLEERPDQRGGAIAIPWWMNCSDLDTRFANAPVADPMHKAVNEKIAARCSAGALRQFAPPPEQR